MTTRTTSTTKIRKRTSDSTARRERGDDNQPNPALNDRCQISVVGLWTCSGIGGTPGTTCGSGGLVDQPLEDNDVDEPVWSSWYALLKMDTM